VKKDTVRPIVDRAEDSSIKTKGETKFITSIRSGNHILGKNPIFRSLQQKLRVLRKAAGSHIAGCGISRSKAKGKAANIGAFSLKNTDYNTLTRLQKAVKEDIAVAELSIKAGGNGPSLVKGHMLASAATVEGGFRQPPAAIITA